MGDTFTVNEIEVHSYIGYHDHEINIKQKVLVTITIQVPSFAKAARTDNVRFSVDHCDIVNEVIQVAKERSRNLIETLAEDLATHFLKIFPISEVTVEVLKFRRSKARSVKVKITRQKIHRSSKRFKLSSSN